jgi:hypothetical protein
MYSSNTSLISNEEKIRILELHYKTKVIESKKKNSTIISEQIDPLPPITDQLNYLKWIRTNCVGTMIGKNGQKLKWIIHKHHINDIFYLRANIDQSSYYVIKGDNPKQIEEWEISEEDNVGDIPRGKEPLKCDALRNAEDKANPLTQGRNVTIGSGAKTLEQLRAMNLTDEDIKQRWQKHPTYANLYIRKDVLKTSAFTDDQQSFINKWKNVPENRRQIDKGVFKLGTEITGNDFAGGWDKNNFFIAEDSEEFFPNGLKVYINTENLEQPNKEMCKTQIKQFADMFKRSRSRKYDSGQVKLMQMYIQDCVNTFNFGGPLSGVKDDLNVLAGRSSNGALRRQDKDWFIQLPSNF